MAGRVVSPGYAQDRALDTTLVEDLASRGYVVASIDHPYDATEVEFPGNRLVLRQQPEPTRRCWSDPRRSAAPTPS